MESVLKAKRRLKLFPKLLGSCGVEGTAYAKCVVQTDDPKLHQCQKEFLMFKKCLEQAAKAHSTRIWKEEQRILLRITY